MAGITAGRNRGSYGIKNHRGKVTRGASGGSADTFAGESGTPDIAGDTPSQPDRTSVHAGGIPGSGRRTSGITGGTADEVRSAPDDNRGTPDKVRDTPAGKRCAPDDAGGTPGEAGRISDDTGRTSSDARDTSGETGNISGDDRCMEINELCRFHLKRPNPPVLTAPSRLEKSEEGRRSPKRWREGRVLGEGEAVIIAQPFMAG